MDMLKKIPRYFLLKSKEYLLGVKKGVLVSTLYFQMVEQIIITK